MNVKRSPVGLCLNAYAGNADIRATLSSYAKAVPGCESKAIVLLDAFLDASTPARRVG